MKFEHFLQMIVAFAQIIGVIFPMMRNELSRRVKTSRPCRRRRRS
jgi:hypothetical protein